MSLKWMHLQPATKWFSCLEMECCLQLKYLETNPIQIMIIII